MMKEIMSLNTDVVTANLLFTLDCVLDDLNEEDNCREFSIAKTKLEEAMMWIKKKQDKQ